jgi:uncharacterized membrane protein
MTQQEYEMALAKQEAKQLGSLIGLTLFEMFFSFVVQLVCWGFLLGVGLALLALLIVCPPLGLIAGFWVWWQIAN